MPVEIMSEIMGKTEKGEISAVLPRTGDAVAGNGSSGKDNAAGTDAEATTPHVPVKIETAKALGPDWNGQDVRVTLTFAQTKAKVLAVPVSAITGRADGQDVVTIVRSNGATSQVAVKTGVSANGMVEVTPVTPGSLSVGDEVGVGS
jgi:HlyD family secretion protein